MAENTYIPLLIQVSVQPPPNIPGRCSPPTAWTQQTPHWAAESGWQDSSCLKQYTSESFWVLSQTAGAYFSRLQGGGRHLCMRNDSPGWPLKDGASVLSGEAHHQALSSAKQDKRTRLSRHQSKLSKCATSAQQWVGINPANMWGRSPQSATTTTGTRLFKREDLKLGL